MTVSCTFNYSINLSFSHKINFFPSTFQILLEDRERDSGSTSGATSAGEQEEIDSSDKDSSKDKKKKNRCAVCRKKVGLTG